MRLQTRLTSLQTAVVCRGQPVPVAAGWQPLPTLLTPRDVLDLLEATTVAVRADPLTGAAEKARAVGRLAAVALKAIEANNLAARMQMLEAVLKLRSGGSTS
jgi:hypothetical protein